MSVGPQGGYSGQKSDSHPGEGEEASEILQQIFKLRIW